ncbi:MAG: hypothetical protein AB1779_09290 [Candidatus Thermoplasmatota archaeon]
MKKWLIISILLLPFIIPNIQSEEEALAETSHPYQNNYNNTWVIISSHANQMRLHFSKIEIGLGDLFCLTDRSGRAFLVFNGTNEKISYSDIWSPWVSGSIVKLFFLSDAKDVCYGFRVDKIDAQTKEMTRTRKVGMFYTSNISSEMNRMWAGNGGGYEACNIAVGMRGAGTNIDAWINGLSSAYNSTYGNLKIVIDPPWFGTSKYVQTITTPSGYKKDLYDVTIEHTTVKIWIASLLTQAKSKALLGMIGGWYVADEPLGKFKDKEAIDTVIQAIKDGERDANVSHIPIYIAYNLAELGWLYNDGYNYNGNYILKQRHTKFFEEDEIMIDWYGDPKEWKNYLNNSNIRDYINADGRNFHGIIAGGINQGTIVTRTWAREHITTILGIIPNANIWFWSWSFGTLPDNEVTDKDSIDEHWDGDGEEKIAKVAEEFVEELNGTIAKPTAGTFEIEKNVSIIWEIYGGLPPYSVSISLLSEREEEIYNRTGYEKANTYLWEIKEDLPHLRLRLSVSDTDQRKINFTTQFLSICIKNMIPTCEIISPEKEDWFGNNSPIFVWNFIDDDFQTGFQIELDDEQNFSTIDYTSGNVSTKDNFFVLNENIKDGIWHVRLKVRDKKNAWSNWSYSMLRIDSELPEATELVSITHPDEEKWYGNKNVEINWVEPEDLCGINGYSYELNKNLTTIPDEKVDGNKTNFSYEADDGIWYFHVRSIDNLGRAGKTTHYKINIDTLPPIIEDFTNSSTNGTIKFNIAAMDEHSGVGSLTIYWRYKGEEKFNMISEDFLIKVNRSIEYYLVCEDISEPKNKVVFPELGYKEIVFLSETDKKPPTIYFITGNISLLTGSEGKIIVCATDKSGIKVAKIFIENEWIEMKKTSEGEYVYNFAANESFSYYVSVFDKNGNVANSENYNVIIYEKKHEIEQEEEKNVSFWFLFLLILVAPLFATFALYILTRIK